MSGPGPETGPELVRLLSGWLEGTDITVLELRTEGETIRLFRPGAAPAAPAAPAPPPSVTVASPAPGVFLDRHPIRTEPLTVPGQVVRAGETVGLLQVGSLLMHVPAPVDGTVVETVAPAGSTVGFGAALLRLHRSRGAE